MINNIPEELRLLPQWVAVDMSTDPETGKPRKAPINPRSFHAASVNDPRTWGTLEQALAANVSPFPGFILTAADPYTFIDLDDPEKMRGKGPDAVEMAARNNQRIYQALETYAEISQSGRGVHLFCRATVSQGHKRDTVELYAAQRLAIFTGNVIKPLPITDQQQVVNQLFAEMGGADNVALDYVSVPSAYSDQVLIDVMCRASNADKVLALCRGEWEGLYPSQSEADMALLSILCFYSPDDEQIKRVFRMTSLGARHKAVVNDAYLNRSLNRVRSKEPPRLDFSKLVLTVPKTAETIVADKPHQSTPYTFPPGLIGRVADYMLGQAIRPVPEVALVGALALVAGIIGRSYNVSGTGLNQYLAVVALTGTGKEAAADGISQLLTAVRTQIPAIEQFFGPGVFASGQAVVRTLDKKPCFVSVLGEFGHTLQTWSDPRQPGAVTRIRQVLLDVYGKSGRGQLLHPSAYSDSDKDTKLVASPCITILGEATPESFFDNLTIDQVAEGLIPRFSIVEYQGERPVRNTARQQTPDPQLVKDLAALAIVAFSTQQNQSICQVPINPEAEQMLAEFDRFADQRIRGRSEVDRQLWNRAHLKALKLAALVAASNCPHAPVVGETEAAWAIQFVQQEVEGVCSRFIKQMYGNGEGRYEALVRDAIEDYFELSADIRAGTYKVPAKLLNSALIPYCYLRRRLKQTAAFGKDRRGVALAIKLALQDLVDAGILLRIPLLQAATQYETASELYSVGPSW